MLTQLELIKDLSTESNIWSQKYPWFSLGHLIDASNNQTIGAAKANESIAIYFNNIHRLHWLLNEQSFNKNKILNDLNLPANTEGMQATPQPFPKREQPQIITEPAQLIAIAAVDEKDAAEIAQKTENVNNIVNDVVKHTEDSFLTESDDDEEIIIESLESDSEKYESNHLNNKAEQKIETQSAESETNDISQIAEVTSENHNISAENEVVKIYGTDEIEENTTENIPETVADESQSEKIKQPLFLGTDAPAELTFEPYHTIDYFASQGIKVDTKTDDRLGKQLKSFTSWLKSMKRLPTTEEALVEPAAPQIHDKSLENTNVTTEAMAAVLVKQGKKEQAIEIFKQLSLLHPEKSRYFAAQIEQIKN